MNAWFVIAPTALILCVAIIIAGRVPRLLWEMCAAFLVLGLAGYAFQGKPQLAAEPAKPIMRDNAAAAQLIKLREQMAPTFASAKNWTILGDSMARQGNYKLAMSVVGSGLKEQPKNADLWAALGLYAMLANNGRIGAPSELAFAKARKFNPNLAAPDYFEGLNALANGQILDTLKKWDAALEKAPSDSQWAVTVRGQRTSLLRALQNGMQRSEPDNSSEEARTQP